MDKNEKNTNEYYVIDVLHIAKMLWKRAWVIILSGLWTAIVGFLIALFLVTPMYSSNVKLYVNNSSFSLGNTSFSISASELTAAQGLVKTYGNILDSRSTYERVIEKAEVDYTWKELSGMVDYAPSNGTEIMKVTVTCDDPYVASKIANTIAEVLPARISEIIDGASMQIVDSAIPELQKVSPGITRYTAIGFIIGAFLSALIIAVIALLDDRIHDEEYLFRTYDYPILGKVPNLLNAGTVSYGAYPPKRPKNN